MPRQLNITTTAGLTVYATLSRITDGQYWNGAAFEAYVDADWATYAVALADSGTGNYTASLPGAFPSTLASYRVQYYQQLAGAPAFTDTNIFNQDLNWNGVTAYTTSVYALTTLAGMLTLLRGTVLPTDAAIINYINGASAAIERICGRKFLARDYKEFFNSNNQLRLLLKNPPLNTVYRLAYGQQNAFNVTYNGTSIRSTAGITNGSLVLQSVVPAGTFTTTSFSFAKYPTVSTLCTAINAVSGWTAVISQDVPTSEIYPTGGQDATARQVFFSYPFFGTPEYWVEADRGIVEYRRGAIWPGNTGWHNEMQATRMPRGFQQIFIHYNAGFTTIPTDVDQKCREVVQDTYYQSLSDTTKQSVRMGEGGYTNFPMTDAAASGIRRDLSTFVLENTLVASGTRS